MTGIQKLSIRRKPFQMNEANDIYYWYTFAHHCRAWTILVVWDRSITSM